MGLVDVRTIHEDTLEKKFVVGTPLSCREEQFTFQADMPRFDEETLYTWTVLLNKNGLVHGMWDAGKMGARVAAMVLLTSPFTRVVIGKDFVLLRATREAWAEVVDGMTLEDRVRAAINAGLDPKKEIPYIKQAVAEEKAHTPKDGGKGLGNEAYDPRALRD
ncbi:MAG: hypothetical protein A3A61_00040 [Candidatus Woykebacteria bacterium RIFCSPLOWO2_01_FULL_43_14]|uniref:Uncharacterized protein n=1 Tax=Candidatus Woykebacteria bacterium RIFCSPLOWO2_01_FULL_43_14 TaxID=1802605 RepID=A0A1G1WYZ0_9BACT|nr:MAG: hypothetical protein A3A61_00040 [Candidatus Woykebacteria bacterium RIFCSPLOWO2_01_FULL_43_14]